MSLATIRNVHNKIASIVRYDEPCCYKCCSEASNIPGVVATVHKKVVIITSQLVTLLARGWPSSVCEHKHLLYNGGWQECAT